MHHVAPDRPRLPKDVLVHVVRPELVHVSEESGVSLYENDNRTMCDRLGCTHESDADGPARDRGVRIESTHADLDPADLAKRLGWRPPPVPQPGQPTMDLLEGPSIGRGRHRPVPLSSTAAFENGILLGLFLGLIISLMISLAVFG